MPQAPLVFLIDVDNTLLDNDRIIADLMRHLRETLGRQRQRRYWTLFDELREQLGYADYLGALQRYRIEHPRDAHVLAMSTFLINYPFANRLYPGALDAIEHVRRFGPAVILSDGDAVFQPRKVERAGLAEAVDGRVLIYIHKERELPDVRRRYPSRHYVLIDDKPRILAAVKAAWGRRVTTVFPRQGHYALDAEEVAKYPPPDVTLARIGDLVEHHADALRRAARGGATR
jgi:FMN phosphatase YigB (HAD superfamily)